MSKSFCLIAVDYIIVETSFEDVVVVLKSVCEVLADEVPVGESIT